MIMSEAVTLPKALWDFVDTAQWTFAKMMQEWPHEYIVRGRVSCVALRGEGKATNRQSAWPPALAR